MIPSVTENRSQAFVEELMEKSGCPIVQVLVERGAQYSVHREKLVREFTRGLFAFHDKTRGEEAICTVGAIRYAALKYIVTDTASRPIGALESFPFDALSESLKGRSHFIYRGTLVIREEGHDTIANPFRFV